MTFSAAGSSFVSGATTLTASHTCSGSNRLLIVSAVCGNGTDFLNGATVTYGGVSMGSAAVDYDSGGSLAMHVWVLKNPPTDANNIVITATGSAHFSAQWSSHTDVDQTTPIASFAMGGGGYKSGSFSTNITVPTGGYAVDAFAVRDATATLTPSQTACAVATVSTVSATQASYKQDATVMTWGFTGASQTVCHCVLALNPASGGGNATPTFPGPNIGNLAGTVGTALTSNNVSSKFSDTDALTFTAIGSWPPGVTVSSAGVISGTPTTAGTYTGLSVRATDTAAQTVDSDTFIFTISAAADTTVPTLTGSISISSLTTTSYTASWSSGSDNVAVTGYQYRIASGSWVDAGNVLTVNISGRIPGATESFEVRAYDAATNYSTPALSTSVTLNSASVGTITIPAVKDWETKALKTGQTGVQVDIRNIATGALVVRKTGQTTHATTGVCVVTDAAIVAGTTYEVVTRFADGSRGMWDYAAT